MAQEVQTTLNYKAELNLIEWVWYQQRRVSHKMQVRDKWGSSWYGETPSLSIYSGDWSRPTSWNIRDERGWVMYLVKGWDIEIPLGWQYSAEIVPIQWLTQTSYYYTIRILVNEDEAFSKTIAFADSKPITAIMLNLGKKDRVTIEAKANSVTAIWSIGFKITQI